MTFQQMILVLQRFWDLKGAIILQPYDIEIGAGTMHPDTFFRVLGPEPWRVAYMQPSRRPRDGRYSNNPFRVYKHYQFQVILKPSPQDVQQLFLDSLCEMGIKIEDHDILFEEDNWEAPTLGAAGVGWQVMLDGMEITQFTYFQQAGGFELFPISAEITYGLERICMFINEIDNVFDIPWSESVKYGEIRKMEEYEMSVYSFKKADIKLHQNLFRFHEAEAEKLLQEKLYIPAYEQCLKCSHIFNVLDSRGALSVTERAFSIQRVRRIACRCAEIFLEKRGELGHPLLKTANRKRIRDEKW
ncbi:MAG: glycine--tRNA ligase subunit alpha [Acidobacteriota bacterium]